MIEEWLTCGLIKVNVAIVSDNTTYFLFIYTRIHSLAAYVKLFM